MLQYSPEGLHFTPPEPEDLRRGAGTGAIFQGICVKCDEFHNLHVDLGSVRGLIPREEAAWGISEGTTKEIALLSRVGKAVSFQVLAFDRHGTAILSRRAAQAEARDFFLYTLEPGTVLPAIVQTAADFGVFCDIGCGFIAMMRIDRCCVSRLERTSQRFYPGQQIYAAVLSKDPSAGQIHLTGRELLGTWEENAAKFRAGQTVPGIVRSIMPYGIFIELTPNLSGLAEPQSGIQIGDAVSVYIRSIQKEKHKIKLNILEVLPACPQTPSPEYFLSSGVIDRWEYYPGSTAFTIF